MTARRTSRMGANGPVGPTPAMPGRPARDVIVGYDCARLHRAHEEGTTITTIDDVDPAVRPAPLRVPAG